MSIEHEALHLILRTFKEGKPDTWCPRTNPCGRWFRRGLERRGLGIRLTSLLPGRVASERAFRVSCMAQPWPALAPAGLHCKKRMCPAGSERSFVCIKTRKAAWDGPFLPSVQPHRMYQPHPTPGFLSGFSWPSNKLWGKAGQCFHIPWISPWPRGTEVIVLL